MGTLRIKGTIDITQFWPTGPADADTTKIKLVVETDSFTYRENIDQVFSPTHAFNDAISKGQGSTPVIKTSKKDGTKTITARLQGVDAPELHYKASPLKRSVDISDEERAKFNSINKERRQCFAESSTLALARHLEKFANDEGLVDAVFESTVDHPFEVIDTYGRFIGNIYVDQNKDINIWLIENGWGLPAFYTSMSAEEINNYLNAWKKGKLKRGRTGKASTKNAGNFDWDLMYRELKENEIFNIGDDKGKVIMPKIFRRQTAWMVSKKAGVLSDNTSFKTYLKSTPDQLMLLNDFLLQGIHSATVFALHDFVSPENIFSKSNEEFVFKEKPGTLVNSNGVKITTW